MGAPSRVIVETGDLVEAFDDYYRRDYRSLVGLAYCLCGSQWVAEDLVQDALTEAHRRWSSVSTYEDPDGWVRRVLVNKSTSRLRRARSEAKGLMRIGSRRSNDVIEPTERSGEVWAAVRALPSRQAQVIALFYWEDRPIREIAAILDITEETTKTHLKRARSRLATVLRDEGGLA